ncbi:hypothetical protein IH824_18510, partial [candidate division KSB1 bacterium]|nr:hypothetical protein [candidate division KSB1 bacterium]
MSEFKPIPNPYIVGNPIKSREMFYGRHDDFDFVKRKLAAGEQSFVIVFCGERRSGKTSILFQILNGELGTSFLPILVDMQTMAGLKNDGEFFEKVAKETVKCLQDDKIDLNDYDFLSAKENPYKVFDKLLDDVQTLNPDKKILFLIDEYELIESKIDEGSLSANLVPFLAGILESERKVSYILTGSTRLDDRESKYWSIMLPKSLYRNVSFLSERDTLRLITEPVPDYVSYEDDALDAIRRLTAGQPFYTQVVCQNIVDHLNDEEKNHVDKQDLKVIADEIMENPLPQMIYFWNSLSNNKKLVLSLLAELLKDENTSVEAKQIEKRSKKRELGINASVQAINTTLESLFHSQFVNKTDDGYSFKMDLFRGWIKRDHSIWSVIKDVGSDLTEEKRAPVEVSTDQGIPSQTSRGPTKRRRRKWPVVVVVATLLGILITRFLPELKERFQGTMPPPEIKTAEPPAQSDDLEPARKAREAMEIAEEQAAQKNASKYAKASFDSGLQLKQQGLTVFDQLDYTSAIDLFQRAKEKFEESVDRAEKEEAIEQTRVKGREDARSRTAAAQSRAISWRNRMSSAKTAAEKVSAAALAEKSFNAAKQKERAARRSFSKKRFQPASTDFQHAQQLYLSAAAEARTASANFATQAEALRNSLQRIKGQLDEQYVFLDEYQQAAKAERNGEWQLQSGDAAAAVKSYQRASELYEASIAVREGQIVEIRSVIA